MTHKLWFPPRLHQHASAEETRKVTWLELFYDLVYVATLVQLGNVLSDDVSLNGFIGVAALFVPIWWAWSGVTFYMNRFVVDDVWHRLLIYVQIVFIALMGLSVDGAFGALAGQFALSYTGIRIVLILLYMRAGQQIPAARPLTNRYVAFFVVGALLWVISAFVPPPFNYGLWALAMLVDLSISFSRRTREQQQQFPPDRHHLIERYGIFTIIVLGESFIKTLTAAAGAVLTPYSLAFSFLGVGVVFSLWWLYFDDVEQSEILPPATSRLAPYVWIYTHLPLAIGLTAFGVASKKLFLEAPGEPVHEPYRLLFSASLIIYALSVAAIDLVTERQDATLSNRLRALVRIGMAVAFALLALVPGLASLPFVLVAAVIMAAQIGLEMRSARRVRGAAQAQPGH